MYISLSPFFYFLANEKLIKEFITIESNGKYLCNIPRHMLESIVSKFIDFNSHGVDECNKDKYVKYICEHI